MTDSAPYAGEHRADIEVRYTEPRNRLTVAFRIILVIPHAILVGLWGYAVEFAAVGQWFVIVFTGRRNRGIWEFQNSYLGYASRVNGYEMLLYDPWPPIGEDHAQTTPTRYRFHGDEDADRLTNALRLIWAIPALLVMIVMGIGAFFVAIASWFAIVFTGSHPRGMWDFLHRVNRYYTQVMAYVLLMSDTYPTWASTEPQLAVPSNGTPPPGEPLPPPAH